MKIFHLTRKEFQYTLTYDDIEIHTQRFLEVTRAIDYFKAYISSFSGATLQIDIDIPNVV